MPAEAWVALGIGLAGILGTIIWAVVSVTGSVYTAVAKFEAVGQSQAKEISEIKEAVEKLEGIVALVAVQKEEIRSLRELLSQLTNRTDETFRRIFDSLDRRQGRDQSEGIRSLPR